MKVRLKCFAPLCRLTNYIGDKKYWDGLSPSWVVWTRLMAAERKFVGSPVLEQLWVRTSAVSVGNTAAWRKRPCASE